MNRPYVMKKCSKCGRWLVASAINFHRGKNFKYGLRNECKECKSKYSKQYNKANRKKITEQQKRWREDNKEKINEYHKQYRKANKERIAEYGKEWREANREKDLERKKRYYEANKEKERERKRRWSQSPQGQVLEFNRRHRRRIKEEQQGTGITKEQWLEMMNFFDWKCAYSGEVLSKDTRSIDHIVPLNSNGDNMIWNCVPMKLNYNSSKHDKDMLEWYKEQDFYSEARLAKIYKWQEYARKKWKN